MSNRNFITELAFFKNNLEHLLDKYQGKYLVIKGEKLLGVYDSEIDAVQETAEKEEMGTFLVQMCERDSDLYTMTFHSRIRFA